MNKYYKILKIGSTELLAEMGDYPLTAITPFGPPFESKKMARAWLKENAEEGKEYYFTRFYSLSEPQNLIFEVKAEKKPVKGK